MLLSPQVLKSKPPLFGEPTYGQQLLYLCLRVNSTSIHTLHKCGLMLKVACQTDSRIWSAEVPKQPKSAKQPLQSAKNQTKIAPAWKSFRIVPWVLPDSRTPSSSSSSVPSDSDSLINCWTPPGFFFKWDRDVLLSTWLQFLPEKKTPFLVLGKNGSTKLKISTFRPNIETSYYDFWEILARLCFIKMYRKVMYFGVSFWRTNQLWPSQLKQLKLDKQTAQHILLTSCMMRWCYHVLWTPWMQESVYIHYYVI